MLQPHVLFALPPLLLPPRVLRPLHRLLLACFWGGWLSGVLYYAGDVAVLEPIARTGPWFVPLTALILLLDAGSRGEQLWLLLCAVGGYAIELLGTSTGWPFSPYHYTPQLGPVLAEVPLSIPVAWLVLCGYARAVLLRSLPVANRAWQWLVGGALWLTLADLVIDPVSAGPLADWVWAQPGPYYGIPLQNFAGWFMTGLLLFALGLRLLPERAADPSALAARPQQTAALISGCGVMLLYTSIALRHGLWIPGALGLALAGASAWLLQRHTVAV